MGEGLPVCRFYGLRASAPTAVECCLVRARNSLLTQSRRDLHGFENADGWGIATYEDGTVRIRRDAAAAHISEEFRSAAEDTAAPTLLAHVRRATIGAMVIQNTHPFSWGRWAFVHNGTVPYFEQLRGRMQEAMAPEHGAAIQGSTDSEHIFHMVLSAHEAAPELPLLTALEGTLRRIARWCDEQGPATRLGLNVLLTDGERMVGSRWQRTLSFLERERLADCDVCGLRHARCEPPEAYRAVVIASEPTTEESAWREVPERSVYEVTPDFRLRIEPLIEA